MTKTYDEQLLEDLDNQTVVIIEKNRLKELEDDSLWRACVENAGVDNWNGFEYAMEEYWESKENG